MLWYRISVVARAGALAHPLAAVLAIASVALSCGKPPKGPELRPGQERTLGVVDASATLAPPDGHLAKVNCLAFSPDGRQLVSGSNDGTLLVWDLASKRVAARYTGHAGFVGGCGFVPDGRRVVSGDAGGEVHIWDRATGERIRQLEGLDSPAAVYSLSVRPDGGEVIVGTYTGRVMAWGLVGGSDGNVVFQDDTHGGAGLGRAWWTVGYLDDGRRFAGGDPEGGVTVIFGPDGPESIPFLAASGVALPGGRLALGGVGQVVIAESEATPRTIGSRLTNVVYGLAVSPRGDRVVVGDNDGSAWVWQLPDGSPLCVPQVGTSGIQAAAYDPTGARFALAGEDGAVRVFDARACTDGDQRAPEMTLQARRGRILGAAAGTDTILLGDGNGRVSAWSLDSLRQTASSTVHRGEIVALAMLPDGRWVSGGTDQAVYVGTEGANQPVNLTSLSNLVFALAPWGDNTVLAADASGRLTEIELEDGQTRLRDQVNGPIFAVAVRPGQAQATASGGFAGLIHVPGPGSDPVFWPDPMPGPEGVTCLAYGPAGHLVTGSTRGSVVVLDPDTGQKQRRLAGLTRQVSGLVVTDRHVWAGGYDGHLARWPLAGGPMHSLPAEGAKIESLAITPDQSRLIAGLTDGRAVVRSLPEGELEAELIPLRDGSWVVLQGPRDTDRKVFASAESNSLATGLSFQLPGDERKLLTLGQSQNARLGGVSYERVGNSLLVRATAFSPGGRPEFLLDGQFPIAAVRESSTDYAAYEVEFMLADPARAPKQLSIIDPAQTMQSGKAAQPRPRAQDPQEQTSKPIAWPPDQTEQGPKRILAIGQHRYAHVSELPGAALDAGRVAKAFGAPLSWNVPTNRRRVRTDLNHTALRTEVEQFFATATAEDTLLFYYAGHGLTHEGEGYLLPTNYAQGQHKQALSASELWRAIEQSPAREILVILDACHSGGLLFPSEPLRTRAEALARQDKAGRKKVAVLTAASAGLAAVESERGGAYTRYLLEAMKDADSVNDDGKILASYAHYYAQRRLTAQAPRISGDPDDFIIANLPTGSATSLSRVQWQGGSGLQNGSYELRESRQITGTYKQAARAATSKRSLKLKVTFGHRTGGLQVRIIETGKRGRVVREAVFADDWRKNESDELTISLDYPDRLEPGTYRVRLIPCKHGESPCDSEGGQKELPRLTLQ